MRRQRHREQHRNQERREDAARVAARGQRQDDGDDLRRGNRRRHYWNDHGLLAVARLSHSRLNHDPCHPPPLCQLTFVAQSYGGQGSGCIVEV